MTERAGQETPVKNKEMQGRQKSQCGCLLYQKDAKANERGFEELAEGAAAKDNQVESVVRSDHIAGQNK